jgi:hypothetical protein
VVRPRKSGVEFALDRPEIELRPADSRRTSANFLHQVDGGPPLVRSGRSERQVIRFKACQRSGLVCVLIRQKTALANNHGQEPGARSSLIAFALRPEARAPGLRQTVGSAYFARLPHVLLAGSKDTGTLGARERRAIAFLGGSQFFTTRRGMPGCLILTNLPMALGKTEVCHEPGVVPAHREELRAGFTTRSGR